MVLGKVGKAVWFQEKFGDVRKVCGCCRKGCVVSGKAGVVLGKARCFHERLGRWFQERLGGFWKDG